MIDIDSQNKNYPFQKVTSEEALWKRTSCDPPMAGTRKVCFFVERPATGTLHRIKGTQNAYL